MTYRWCIQPIDNDLCKTMHRRLIRVILTLLTLAVFPRSRACILLLNGWEPISAGDRAKLAEVVFSGEAVKTYKNRRDSVSKTYTAGFSVQQVFKGQEIVHKVVGGSLDKNELAEEYYNVTNFGDRSMCYADVKEGQRYIVFATEFNGALSAKYDDLFGAAEEFTDAAEREILTALGWRGWSDWSPCDAPCNGGTQERARDCPKMTVPQCTGQERERRRCNLFTCKGMTDLLSLIKSPSTLPPGVSKDKSRPGAYLITQDINTHEPLKNLFPDNFPEGFSILVTVKFLPDTDSGFLFTVSDLLGFVLLGIQVGPSHSNFVYNPNYVDSKDSFYDLNLDLSGKHWNQMAFSVFVNGSVLAYVNCTFADSIQLKSDRTQLKHSQTIGQDTVISLGRTFHQNSNFPSFQGSIEQLVITDDPLAGSLQCEDSLLDPSPKPSPDDVIHTDPWQPSEEVTGPLGPTLSAETIELSWSVWSECSTTCGKGTKTRTASCPDNSGNKCLELVKDATQKSPCNKGRCPVPVSRCKRTCHNGGRCEGNNRCSCLPGYFGRSCQKVRCYPRCENGGRCVMPNRCSCPVGWGGRYCHRAKCNPPCANGGRCVQPDVCACPYGYLPPDCRAYCSSPCYNGGSCIGFNMCKCLTGYTGRLCQTAVCVSGCGAGGQCVAPDKCVCAAGWTGDSCREPLCEPGCSNGGTCVLPFFCICPPATYGTTCQHYMCNPTCLNGGTCVAPNQCRCLQGYSGNFCQEAVCPSHCYNGGSCVLGRCRCQQGYYGDSCQHRICKYRAERIPSYRRHSVPFYYTENYPCGTWPRNDICSATRLSYRTVYHLEHRVVYRCT